MICFNATYFEDHLYLLELSTFLEPETQYGFNATFQSIDSEITNFELWDTRNNESVPTPYQEGDYELWNWYQYWFNCAHNQQSAEFTENELRELFDYNFEVDETIYTGDFLDQ